MARHRGWPEVRPVFPLLGPYLEGTIQPVFGDSKVLRVPGLDQPLGVSSFVVPAMSEVTRILSALEQGDPHAAEQLLPLVYEELRRLAAAQMMHEKPGQTLDATALVHEAYLRLLGEQPATHARKPWASRRHFSTAAAEAMQRILIDNARRKKSQKRGGGRVRLELAANLAAPERSDELLSLDEALAKLAVTDATAAELVKLRFFAGLSIPQAAEVLGIGARSADRLWAYARAWLRDALEAE